MKQEKRRILFFAKGGFNVAVYERVLRRLLADPRIEMTFSARDTLGRSDNPVFEPFGFERARRVHYRLARLFRYDLYLSPDIYCLGRRARVKAHTFHGISIKGQSFSKKALVYDRLFLIGSYQRRRFAELGVTSEDDPRFVNIGMPKTDAFFDDSLSRNSFLKDLGLDPDRKTVLYAPTWRPE
ncbi:MAG: CDP-glycerol glycerophosphotransferase family protein, partial [Proteobacteria bacterium]|nr:CDP-glycerol glycerophosphotransferase family protein [Pseudomonadota bacterium]